MPQAPFVGRERERKLLATAVEEAERGTGSLVLLTGEAGIGKSRLADLQAQAATERGFVVARGQASEVGGAPPLWPWIQVLRGVARSMGPAGARAAAATGLRWLVAIDGELGRLLDAGAADPVSDEDGQIRFAVADATAVFLCSAAAQRPLLVVLEDLHAADGSTLELLGFVATQLGAARLVVLATYRDLETRRDPRRRTLVADLERVGSKLTLRGLSRDEAWLLAQEVAPEVADEALVERLQHRAGGNPLFLSELLRLPGARPGVADEPVPLSVRSVIARRLSLLDDDVHGLLRVAAVLGRDIPVRLLARVSGRSDQDLVVALSRAVAAGLVETTAGSSFRFVHVLFRDVLYEEIPVEERSRMHLAAAGVLERDADVFAGAAAALAHHYARSLPIGDVERALYWARRAADAALYRHAYDAAAAHLDEALELCPEDDRQSRLDLLLLLGDALAKAGAVGRSRDVFIVAAELARVLGRPRGFAAAALGYGGTRGGLVGGDPGGPDDRLIALLDEAMSALPEGEDALRSELSSRLALALWHTEPGDETRRRLVEAAAVVARRLGDARLLALALWSRFFAVLDPPPESDAVADELVRALADWGDPSARMRLEVVRGRCALERGDVEAAALAVRRYEDMADELRFPADRWRAAVHLGGILALRGRLDDLERLQDRCLELGRSAGLDEQALSAWGILHGIVLQRTVDRAGIANALNDFRSMAERFPALAPAKNAIPLMMWFIEEPGARDALEAAMANLDTVARDVNWPLTVSLLADAASHLGAVEHAGRLYELLVPYRGRNILTASVDVWTPADRNLGGLEALIGRLEEAEKSYEAAVAMCLRIADPARLIFTLIDYSAMLLERDAVGDRDRARELLAWASREAAKPHMAGWAPMIERVRAQLSGRAAPVKDQRGELRREGDVWRVTFAGFTVRVRATKGLVYLGRLLAEPGREFHALDLVGARAAAGPGERGDHAGGDLGPLVDDQARAAYRRRIGDLRAEIDDARSAADPARAERAKEELDALVEELRRSTGLGGRSRTTGSDAERARVAATKAIRAAIARIGEHHDLLGRHLSLSVRTGTFCSYNPDPAAPIAWAVERC